MNSPCPLCSSTALPVLQHNTAIPGCSAVPLSPARASAPGESSRVPCSLPQLAVLCAGPSAVPQGTPRSPFPSPAIKTVWANVTAHISLPRAGPCVGTSICLCRWIIRFPFHFLSPPDGFSGWQFPHSPAQSSSISQREILLPSSPGCCSWFNMNSSMMISVLHCSSICPFQPGKLGLPSHTCTLPLFPR